jgi:Uma2 family endonuclease
MGPLSYKEFLATDFENEHVEWVDGRVVELPPVDWAHQSVSGFLIAVLGMFVEERKLGRILHRPFQMKLDGDLPGRAPDLLFVSTAHKKRLKWMYLEGPADLVVEIVGPGSRETDRGEKFSDYEKGGVLEYWLIDPKRKQVDFFLLNQRGKYHPAKLNSDGIFNSKMISGVWIRPQWFWADPPTILSIVRKWLGIGSIENFSAEASRRSRT